MDKSVDTILCMRVPDALLAGLHALDHQDGDKRVHNGVYLGHHWHYW